MIIGHQKGVNTKMRQYRNFGMANPEGYRKALRLMKLAEKFNRPVIIRASFRVWKLKNAGRPKPVPNLFEMTLLKVPVICIVIGEGASAVHWELV